MRHSLRTRIFAVCFTVATGVSLLFGALSLWILEGLEFEQIDLILQAEMEHFLEEQAHEPARPPPRGRSIRAWSAPLADLSTLPAALRTLEPGYHEQEIGTTEYRIAVEERDGRRYVMTLDLALTDVWEDRVAGIVVALAVVCSLLGALLGRGLARRVLEPVTRLAGRVTDERSAPRGEPFAAGQSDDEIGHLAQALDEHVRRLRDYARREHEFTGHVSHELRTPLAVAASAVELLLADPTLPANVHRRLQGAERSLAAMLEMVEALLALARAEAGTGVEVELDVAALLDEVVSECRTQFPEHAITVEVEVAGRPRVRALPGALRIVMRNLLANACVHTPAGTVHVRLDPHALTVSDTGPGIARAELERIHERHFRGSAAVGTGEGLGLAIVQRLCHRHGWQMRIESEPGRGTRAHLTFVRCTRAPAGASPHDEPCPALPV